MNGIPQLTSNFITENTDWFGQPIHHKTVKPNGPGLKYSIPYSYLSEIGGVLNQTPRQKETFKNADLGPGTYDPETVPSKVSFFLNQNNLFIP